MTWNDFWGICTHRWKVLEVAENTLIGYDGIERPNGARYILQCDKCGDIKSVRV